VLVSSEPDSTSYFAAEFALDAERERLSILERTLDPITTSHLARLAFGGGRPPRRCLEMGAGGGSIARWLARMAPDATVVAADIDTRFLVDLPPAVEVRPCDITTDALEPLAFDLVHCRLLLLHLADPMAALQKLADSVAPGGLLLVEEWDYATTNAYQTGHPLAAVVNRVNDALFGLTLGMGINVWLGRDLPDMVEATGLRDVDHLGSLRVTRGTPEPTMQKASTALLRGALTGRGLATEAEVDDWFRALSDPTFRMIDYTTISVWGHRPTL
jgi:SAM-dependent methyltransferase